MGFNETTGVVEGAVQFQSPPNGVTFDPANDRLYVAVSGGSVAAISAANMSVLASIHSGCGPWGLAYDGVQSRLYVTDYCSGNVTVIATGNNSVIGTIPLGSAAGPEGIVYDPFNDDVYVAESVGCALGVISAASDTVNRTIAGMGCPTGVASNSASGDVYVVNGADLVVVSGQNETIVAKLDLGGPTDSVAFDANLDRIYVAWTLYQVNNMTAVNASDLAIVGNVAVHEDPEGLAVDELTGTLFVADYGASDLGVVNLTAWSLVGFFRSDPAPFGLAWDSFNGDIYATTQVYGTLYQVDETTNTVGSSAYLDPGLTGVVSDPANGNLFAGSPNNGKVYEVNGTSEILRATPVGADPYSLTYDTENGNVYDANYNAGWVSVLNGTDGSLVGQTGILTPISGPLTGAAFDPTNGYVYVAYQGCLCSGPGNVTIINGATDQVEGSIDDWANPGPSALTVDTQNDQLYVTDSYSNLLWAFNLTSDAFIAAVPVGSSPEGLALDNATGDLYVTNSGSNNVTVVDTSTDRTIGSFAVGLNPVGAAYDPANGNVYVANEDSGTVSIVHVGVYALTFEEQGLPTGTRWVVTVGNSTEVSSNATESFRLPNGTFSYSISGVAGWRLQSISDAGFISVNGSNDREFVNWSEVTYSVTFREQGLPSGTNWSVQLGGATSSSGLSTVGFTLPNGTFPFSIPSIAGYRATPETGNTTVQNGSEVVTVNFEATNSAPGIGLPILTGGLVAAAVAASIAAFVIIRRKARRSASR